MNLLKQEILHTPDFNHELDVKSKYVPHFISMGKGMGPKGKPETKVL